ADAGFPVGLVQHYRVLIHGAAADHFQDHLGGSFEFDVSLSGTFYQSNPSCLKALCRDKYPIGIARDVGSDVRQENRIGVEASQPLRLYPPCQGKSVPLPYLHIGEKLLLAYIRPGLSLDATEATLLGKLLPIGPGAERFGVYPPSWNMNFCCV